MAGSGLDPGLDVDDDEDAGGAVVDGGAAEVPPGMDDEVEVSQGTFEIHFKKFCNVIIDEIFFVVVVASSVNMRVSKHFVIVFLKRSRNLAV